MLMYVLMAEVVVLFWIVGVATGIVSTIFLLELEHKYIFQPAKYFVREMQIQFSRNFFRFITSSKRVFRSMLILNSRRTARVPR